MLGQKIVKFINENNGKLGMFNTLSAKTLTNFYHQTQLMYPLDLYSGRLNDALEKITEVICSRLIVAYRHIDADDGHLGFLERMLDERERLRDFIRWQCMPKYYLWSQPIHQIDTTLVDNLYKIDIIVKCKINLQWLHAMIPPTPQYYVRCL